MKNNVAKSGKHFIKMSVHWAKLLTGKSNWLIISINTNQQKDYLFSSNINQTEKNNALTATGPQEMHEKYEDHIIRKTKIGSKWPGVSEVTVQKETVGHEGSKWPVLE